MKNVPVSDSTDELSFLTVTPPPEIDRYYSAASSSLSSATNNGTKVRPDGSHGDVGAESNSKTSC